jgi:hypothetical protein
LYGKTIAKLKNNKLCNQNKMRAGQQLAASPTQPQTNLCFDSDNLAILFQLTSSANYGADDLHKSYFRGAEISVVEMLEGIFAVIYSVANISSIFYRFNCLLK